MSPQPSPQSTDTLTPQAVSEWLRSSCERQNLPVTIRDPNVVAQVATLLGKPSTRASGKQPASGAPRPPGLPTVAFATTDLDGAGDDATADTDNGRRCAAVEHQINKQVA
jgi:hypothetical protein